MVDVTLWTGPVGNAQVPACFVPGSLFPPAFSCQNPEPPPERQRPGGHIFNCQTRAEQVRQGDRYLPGMLRAVGVNPADVQNVYLASFSAGHNVVKDRVFLSPADRAMVKTFYSCDSTYTGWVGDNPKLGPAPKRGHVDFMLDCLHEKKLFLASAGMSTPMGADGKPLPSSAQTMWGLAAEVERITGKKFVDYDLGVSIKPAKAMRLDGASGGSIILADFPLVQHQDQPRLIAPMLWRGVLLKWLNVDPCGAPAMMGLGAGESCPVYRPEGAEPWMVSDAADAGFMDDETSSAPAHPTGWGAEQYALFGVGALAGWAAWNGFSPLLSRRRRSR